jgi:hypothetical protein
LQGKTLNLLKTQSAASEILPLASEVITQLRKEFSNESLAEAGALLVQNT